MWDGGLLNREVAAGLRARGSRRGLYAALRTVPRSGNSYVAPCPASYVSRAPVGDAIFEAEILRKTFVVLVPAA
jgi:hypothetical protein